MAGGDAFADVLTANAEYARGFSLAGLSGSAGRGLAVVTCMDSRIEPLSMLGLRPGDAKILRNPGGHVDDGVLATLVLSRHLLGVERAMVIAHTDCRMTAPHEDVLHDAIAQAGGPDTHGLAFAVAPSPEERARAGVERIGSTRGLAGLEAGGFVYDVESGRLSRVA